MGKTTDRSSFYLYDRTAVRSSAEIDLLSLRRSVTQETFCLDVCAPKRR